MHSIVTDSGTTFHHNGDYSGDVIIHRDAREVSVPFADLKMLVASFVRGRKIEVLEQADDDVILGIRAHESISPKEKQLSPCTTPYRTNCHAFDNGFCHNTLFGYPVMIDNTIPHNRLIIMTPAVFYDLKTRLESILADKQEGI